MNFRVYLILMALVTIIDIGAWGFIVETVNPYDTTAIGIAFFFLTMFLGLVGIVSLIESMVRVWLLGREVIIREVAISFRHGVLLSMVAVGSVFLVHQQWFFWWTLLLLIIGASVVEYGALMIQHSRRR